MYNLSIKNKNINKKLIYSIFITSLLWPFFQIIISQNTNTSSSFFTSIPVVIISLYVLINFRFTLDNRSKNLIILNIIYLFYIFFVSYFFNNLEYAMRGLKTCGILSIYFIFVLIAKDELINEYYNIDSLLIILAGIVAIFYYFEIIARMYDPDLFGIYHLASIANFSGIGYLGFNDISGLFSGARPLGIYFDMHTGPGLILLTTVYFFCKKKLVMASFFMATLLITHSTSTVLCAIPLIFLLSKRNRYLSLSILIIGSAILLDHIIGKENSLNNILFDINEGLNIFASQNFFGIFFGEGYDPDGSKTLAGGESFLIHQIAFFGLFGFVYFIYLAISNLNFKSQSNLLLKLYVLSLTVLLAIHYNNLFNVSSALVLALIFLYFNLNNSKNKL